MKSLRHAALALALAALAALAAPPVAAQNFPERPITLICPWPAGGGTDVAMRALAEAVAKQLGQRVIIENRPGAAGTVGPGSMAQTAKPDGYTISQMAISVFRIPYLQKVNYDPNNDFTWIIGITGYTFGVVVRSDSPWKTWQELIAYARANPGKFSYASPGTGTSLHITMEEIAQREGIQWLHVPFKGQADATAAVLGGHVNASADSTGWGEMVDAGRLRMLVSWGAERTKRWPSVPTLKELGYGIVSNSPYGIAGPKGMDPKVVKILHDAFKKAIDDPAYVKTIERLDQEKWYLGSEDYAKYARETFAEQKVMMERLGLKQ
jgi:tripartite-type tricarboxylate transporter receptor subunit TctC